MLFSQFQCFPLRPLNFVSAPNFRVLPVWCYARAFAGAQHKIGGPDYFRRFAPDFVPLTSNLRRHLCQRVPILEYPVFMPTPFGVERLAVNQR